MKSNKKENVANNKGRAVVLIMEGNCNVASPNCLELMISAFNWSSLESQEYQLTVPETYILMLWRMFKT